MILEVGATVQARDDPSRMGLVLEIQNEFAPPNHRVYVVAIPKGGVMKHVPFRGYELDVLKPAERPSSTKS